MPRGTEQKLQDQCRTYFAETAATFGLKLDENVQVLSDVTCVKDSDFLKLALGFAAVDLAFYLSVTIDESHWATQSAFKLLRRRKEHRGAIHIPFLVFELKRGNSKRNGITVDAIRSRTIVAQRIKALFPFCSYLFLADCTNKANETVLRHGKDFTNYFLFREAITENQLIAIDEQFVRPHLENLKRIGMFV